MDKSEFDKETLKKMKSTLRETKDKELAFSLCKRRNDRKITHGQPTCIGNYCEVDSSESKCKSGDKDVGSFHTHIDNTSVSIEDLINTYDQEVMCVGSKSLIPFFQNIECYSIIDKGTKLYAIELIEDYNKIHDGLSRKIIENKITVPQANLTKEKEYDNTVRKLLPLFHRFKV